ncbi:MAG: hypothetical protein KF708_08795 [Pirellulales bacterium]|nr:hypothetical protein [Pirellulales bacterium]
MSSDRPRQSPPKSNLRWPAAFFGLFGALAGFVIIMLSLFSIHDYVTAPVDAEAANPTPPKPPTAEVMPPANTRPEQLVKDLTDISPTPNVSPTATFTGERGSASEQAFAHAKSRQRTFLAKGREITLLLDTCDDEIKQWNERVRPLLENDDGRKIASNVDLVSRFRAAYQQDRPSQELVQSYRESLEDMLSPIRLAFEIPENTSLPTAASADELSRMLVDLRRIRDELRVPRQRAEAVSAESKQLAMHSTTLQAAIDALTHSELLDDSKIIDDEVVKARREAAEKLAKSKADLIRKSTDDTIMRDESDAERARLTAKAKSPDIQRILRPFTDKGYVQPYNQGGVVGFKKTTVHSPMSYTAIESLGALEPTMKGLNALNALAIGNTLNDRATRWQFHVYSENWSRSDQDYLQKVQDTLRELGQTLVELEMLAP